MPSAAKGEQRPEAKPIKGTNRLGRLQSRPRRWRDGLHWVRVVRGVARLQAAQRTLHAHKQRLADQLGLGQG